MNYTSLFYWLTVADNAKLFVGLMAIFFTVIFVIAQCVRFGLAVEDNLDTEKRTMVNKWTWYSTPWMILFLSLWIFTPSKKDALLIVAGGQTMNFLTTDSSAKRIPSELTHFVVTELKNMAKDAEVNLNIQSQKDKILDEAKTLTGMQLIEKLKTDSTFAKVILNQ